MMSINSRRLSALIASVCLAGCTALPTPGPTKMALPGSGSTLEQFRGDDLYCQDYALQASGQKTAQQVATNNGAISAVIGTLVGAAAGALLGAASGNAGAGAAIGAGGGLLIGGAAGTDAARVSGAAQQQRYDNAYVQCMYTKGHQVPVPAGAVAPRPAPAPTYAPPPAYSSGGGNYPPPPPPNY